MKKFKQNITVGCQTGSRFVRFIIAVMLIVPLMLGMSSCSSNDKDKVDEPVIDNASELYGIWVASGTTEYTNNGVNITSNWENTIIFNSQGRLLIEEYAKGGGAGGEVISIMLDFKSWYEVIENTIKVYRVYNGTSEESVLSYKIIGNNLILEYVSGDRPFILRGKDKVAYTIKSKGDILEYPYGFWNAKVSSGNIEREFSLNLYLDNKISVSEKNSEGTGWKTLENYKYSFSGNIIELYKEVNSSAKPDCTLSYKVVGNNITFEYISGEKPLFISVFNADKATYTGNN